ncbi:7889_t:CDS:1, partial [Entrophospora sp. SA101]
TNKNQNIVNGNEKTKKVQFANEILNIKNFKIGVIIGEGLFGK